MQTNTWTAHLDETKRGLARLLARENLIVRHADVPTAFFDLKNRTLVLPKWTNITVDQYDLLIGHEVGHALFSDEVAAFETASEGLRTYINVLEDVRIERRIKEEFPGLRGSFTRGYRDFFEKGPIFQLEKPAADYDFIDRINIHYKIGAHVAVPFSDEERTVLARLDRCRTMAEIVALARELYTDQQKQNQQKQETPGLVGATCETSDPTSQTAPTPGTSEGSNSQPSSGTGQDAKDDAANGQSKSRQVVRPDQTTVPSSAQQGNAEGSEGSVETDPMAATDKSNANALKTLSREKQTPGGLEQVMLAPASAETVRRCTVSNEQFVTEALQHIKSSPQRLHEATTYLAEFQTKYAATVAHMAREFDRRKTAKLYERARVARTGRLDMTKLASYKFRDDLFQQIMVVPNGKSHGIVLLIDGSGSMNRIFNDVFEQVMLFTQFAQRVQVPVRAFMFHDNYTATSTAPAPSPYTAYGTAELVCVYDSTQKSLNSQQLVLAGIASQFRFRNRAEMPTALRIPHIDLHMTPLNGGLWLVERQVAALKADRRLEKTTLIVLTDGDATDWMSFNGESRDRIGNTTPIYKDTVTRHIYDEVDETTTWDGRAFYVRRSHADTFMLVDSIRRRHETRVVRIHITNNSDLATVRRDPKMGVYYLTTAALIPMPDMSEETVTRQFTPAMLSAMQESAKSAGQITFVHPLGFYDAFIVVTSDALDLDADEFASKDMTGWTPRKIATAFTKANVNAMKNRVFVNSVVPFLA